jgi:hypothetical protein
MAFQMHSQTTLKIEQRAQTLINSRGDRLVQMSLADAKILLTDLYDKQIADSLVGVYMFRDSLNLSRVALLKREVDIYKEKCGNYAMMLFNDTKVIVNKNTELDLLNKIIKDQKKEIRKQKVLKVIGFTGAVVLPIIVIILMTHN